MAKNSENKNSNSYNLKNYSQNATRTTLQTMQGLIRTLRISLPTKRLTKHPTALLTVHLTAGNKSISASVRSGKTA